jgi:hypothetical protein
MTVEHPNFYENLAEANMRLRKTIVLYEDEPVYIWAITNHKKDGIFRIYCQSLDTFANPNVKRPEVEAYPQETPELGTFLDKFIESNPKTGIMRKQMNSPHFHKFRPFPLGMCNTGELGNGRCYYLERQPQRRTEQGLTRNHIDEHEVSLSKRVGMSKSPYANVELYSKAFYATVKGQYPTAQEVLEAFKDPDIDNEAVAFNRYFALLRGPVSSTFLGYKDRVVGYMPEGSTKELRLSKKHVQTKEVIEDLNIFENISIPS